MLDWLKSERRKYRVKANRIILPDRASLSRLDPRSRELYGLGLPRGVLLPRLERDRERMNFWMSPGELLKHHFAPGQILLGKFAHQFIGHMDDRPMASIAQSRSGKTSTVIEPNVLLYPGSMLLLDPKRSFVHLAEYRRALGHDVHVLDPFGLSTSSFNPLAELNPDDKGIVDDVTLIANALVPDDGDPRSRHWNDGARKLIIGIILLVLTFEMSERNLVTVRQLLSLSYPPLAEAARLVSVQEARSGQGRRREAANGRALEILLMRMKSLGQRFGGIPAQVGDRFLNMPEGERGSHFSTAATQTDFLDSLLLRRCLLRSDFKLSALRSDRPTTIILSLSVGRIEPHARWLRLIVQLACIVLERMGPYPTDRPRILFLFEEAPVLGHMRAIENSAEYFPEFGIKAWLIAQNLTQLQQHYRDSWQTILGNCGVRQFFANGDDESLSYIVEHTGKLIEREEIRRAFARERGNQILLMSGETPAALPRLGHDEVAMIRNRIEQRISTRRFFDQ